ncbi:MAG: UDP-N-acetylmuramate dehydrogenase [Lachnospiraceae bacterium]|nr:UDP-N-acetylmuramate dehydrogenase [Lachnospiraceae bacterium]
MRIYLNNELNKFTSFKIGGIADVIAEPKDIKELVELIKFLRKNYIKYYILGNGTNLLISDKGVRGCVVHIGSNLSSIKLNGNKIIAEAGALMKEISQFALKHNLGGFEELSGIPGSIGGATAMNAGAYGKEIKDLFSSANAINESGRVIKLTKDSMDFSNRKSSVFEKGYIITSVTLGLQESKKEIISKNIEKFTSLRQKNQPLDYPSAGSVFKRPEGGYASLMIKNSNLMGERIGDAEVSTLHAGFIVNRGKAKASDVYKLMNKIKDDVKTYFNVELEPEIKLWGKF